MISLRLCGRRAAAPASVVMPLLVSDLPVFLRWRGPLPFGAPELEQLVGVADRLVVDSREWPDRAPTSRALPALFDRIAVSDISWARTEPWRARGRSLAGRRRGDGLRVAGPEPEALLLQAGSPRGSARRSGSSTSPPGRSSSSRWTGARRAPAVERLTPSDLLSDQLEVFGRDRIFEEAVRSFSSQPT